MVRTLPCHGKNGGSTPLDLVMNCIPKFMDHLFDGLEKYVELSPAHNVVYKGEEYWECSSIYWRRHGY